MFFIAYAFKGQVRVFAGLVKIVSHSSCRTSAILKYFCPLMGNSKNGVIEKVLHINTYLYPRLFIISAIVAKCMVPNAQAF